VSPHEGAPPELPRHLPPDLAEAPGPEAVPTHPITSMVAALEQGGISAEGALAAAGLDRATLADRSARVTQAQEARFLEHAMADTGNPCIGAELGLSLDLRRTTLLSYIVFNSPDLAQALKNLVRFVTLVRPATRLALRREGDRVELTMDNADPRMRLWPQHAEWGVALLVNILRVASRSDVRPAEIDLIHRRERSSNQLAGLFRCPVRFGSAEVRLVYLAEDLRHPIEEADANLLWHLTGVGRLLLELRAGERGRAEADATAPGRPQAETAGGVIDRVRRLVLRQPGFRPPPAEEVARSLGMSRRTLVRRLAECGTGFREVVEGIRVEAAKTYLRDPDLSLVEITYLLGYADQGTFGAAFRRATGATPRRFRLASLRPRAGRTAGAPG
jgi:AraC-like DNA-binding protein